MEIEIDYGAILVGLLAYVIYTLFVAVLIGLSWNMGLADLFGLPRLDYSEALLLFVFVRLLLLTPFSINPDNAGKV